MRYLRRGFPLLIPSLFHVWYKPINEGWTVRVFGCGCPVDGVPTFNANHVNHILWCVVWLFAGIAWCWSMRLDVNSARSVAVCAAGIGLLAGMCNDFRCLEFWF